MRNRIAIASNDGGYSFRKRTRSISLPYFGGYPEYSGVEDCLKCAIQLDETIDAFDKLVGPENNFFIPNFYKEEHIGQISITLLNHYQYFKFKNSYSKSFVNNPWKRMERTLKLGKIHYTKNNIEIHISEAFQTIAFTLTQEKAPEIQQRDQFTQFINRLTDAIDNLFIQQGYEPTERMRTDLIMLAYGSTEDILGKQEIQNLLGTTLETHTITHPNLIRLAAKGTHDAMLKVFYAHDVYPETTDDMLELANMPFDLFYKIWAGER